MTTARQAPVPLQSDEVLPLAFALAAAHERGLLRALSDGPVDAAELHARLGLDERALALTMEMLVSFGVVARDQHGYVTGPVLREATKSSPTGLATDLALWASLPRFLTDGAPATAIDLGVEGRALLYAGVVAGLGEMWNEAAQRLARALAGHGPRVLDVGCGSGVWSLALAAARPDCTVTGLDFAPVLTAFERRAGALGVASRARALPGDTHVVELPRAAFDVVIVANVLRLETETRAAGLLQRLAPAVAPGGQLVVVDALAEGSAAADRRRAIYALHLGMRTREGGVHTSSAIAGWLTAAGLNDAEAIDLEDAFGAAAGLRAWRRA